MNTHEWQMYANVLEDYLASEEGLKVDPIKREKLYKELDRVNALINERLGLPVTNESIIADYNPENEIQ